MTFFSDTKHNDDANIDHKFERQSISNFVVDDISMQKSRDSVSVVFDKDGMLKHAIPDIFKGK